MATAGSNLTKDRFQCSICLDVFTQPVSLPCGHNFCKACITNCWNSNASGLCQCPMCKKMYKTRPELHVNSLLSDMAEQFRKSAQVTEEQEIEDDVPGETFCEVCIDPKMKAFKSCLVCVTSYCETHLEPHSRVETLKTHQLVEPLGSMEDRMCKKHNKILELFCRKEQRCICILCSQTDHRSHDVVALEDESGKRKAVMRKTKADCKKYIQEREQELQEIRDSAKADKEAAEKETADGVEVLDALVASIQKKKAELQGVIEKKQEAAQQKAEQSITELQQEIAELQKTNMDCEKLSCSEDHFQVLMYSLPSPSTIPGYYSTVDKVLTSIVPQDNTAISPGTVRAAVTKLEKTLNEGMETLIKQLENHLEVAKSSPPQEAPPSPPLRRPTSLRSAHQPSSLTEPPSTKPPVPSKPSAPNPDSSKALSPAKALAKAFGKQQKGKKRGQKSEDAILGLPRMTEM